MQALERTLDYATAPLFIAASIAATRVLQVMHVEGWLWTALVLGPLFVLAAAIERVRPEREEYLRLDQPLATEAAHFLLNYQLGYALSLGALALVRAWMQAHVNASMWPVAWPLAVQVVIAVGLSEGAGYWQHRLFHRIPSLWRFHELHHSGGRLNVSRSLRFHGVDIGAGTFLSVLPLVLLRAPEDIVLWVVVLSGALGIVQHANMRMRTPAWLDRFFCTPAVHRHHHSRNVSESNRNFGTTVMLFDVLFGSYEPPKAEGPAAMGIEGDTMPRGFWKQVVRPFQR